MPSPPFTSLCISGLIRPIAFSFCCRTEVLDFPNFQSPHIKVCTIGFLVRLSCTTTYMIYRSFPDISNNENGVQRDIVVQGCPPQKGIFPPQQRVSPPQQGGFPPQVLLSLSFVSMSICLFVFVIVFCLLSLCLVYLSLSLSTISRR